MHKLGSVRDATEIRYLLSWDRLPSKERAMLERALGVMRRIPPEHYTETQRRLVVRACTLVDSYVKKWDLEAEETRKHNAAMARQPKIRRMRR